MVLDVVLVVRTEVVAVEVDFIMAMVMVAVEMAVSVTCKVCGKIDHEARTR
jgi:hypothetical protein